MKAVVCRFIAVSLLFLSALVLQPKTGYAQDGCEAFVTSGLRQSKESYQSSEWSLQFLARLTKMSWQDAAQELSRHGGSVGWGDLAIKPGDYNSSKHEEVKTYLSTRVSIDEVLRNQSSLIINSGDPILTNGYLLCREMGGFTFLLEKNGPENASLLIRWKPYPTAPNVNPELSSNISVINGDIISGKEWAVAHAKLGINLNRDILIRRRDPKKELILALHTVNAGGATAYLPPSLIEVPPPSPKRCVAYRKEHPAVGTCNENTDDGYYWRIKYKVGTEYPQIEKEKPGYGINAVPSGANPRCGKVEADAGNVYGYTVRYPPEHQEFLDVRENWTMAPPLNNICHTIREGVLVPELAGADVSSICGKFKAVCSRQE